MKRHSMSAVVAAFSASVLFAADGCSINPWNTPDIEYAAGGNASASSSSAGGGGTGGSAGAGGSAGEGGTIDAGADAEPCTCKDDQNVCTAEMVGMACPNDIEAECHTPIVAGQCPSGICDQAGQCSSCLACADAACVERCDGQPCSTGDICQSKACSQGTCCNVFCLGPCRACNRPGKEGTCTQLPLGLKVEGCAANEVCNNGLCTNTQKAALGALCNGSSACASNFCRVETCRSGLDQPCVEHLECVSNLCDPETKTCKLCAGAGSASCPTGSECMTQNGWCKVFLGQPAQADVECAQGTVAEFLCGLPKDALCTEHSECASRNCLLNGKCAPSCSDSTQCVAGGLCTSNGTCELPTGNYCIVNSQCISKVCDGFPRRCK